MRRATEAIYTNLTSRFVSKASHHDTAITSPVRFATESHRKKRGLHGLQLDWPLRFMGDDTGFPRTALQIARFFFGLSVRFFFGKSTNFK